MKKKNNGFTLVGIVVAIFVIVIFIIIAVAMLRSPNTNPQQEPQSNIIENTQKNMLVNSNTVQKNEIENETGIPQPKEPIDDNPINFIPTPTEQQNDMVSGSQSTR